MHAGYKVGNVQCYGTDEAIDEKIIGNQTV